MLPALDIVQRLVLASGLGAIVGAERERLERGAGLRTHALVGVGAALFMIVSAFGFAVVLMPPQVGLDPSRIAVQVVSGIGFLGAGTNIFQREIVRGLTTAASIWAVAAIEAAVDAVGLRLVRVLVEPGGGLDEDRVDLTVSGGRREAIDGLSDRLRVAPGVRRISSVRVVAEGEEGSGDDTEGGPPDATGDHPAMEPRR
jgi:hypothetical protein